MITVTDSTPISVDSPESRSYNRVKRWLGVADFGRGLLLLVVLLATGWSGTLRDLALRGASSNYSVAVFLYVLMLMVISRVLGFPLDYYGFRLDTAITSQSKDCAPGCGTNSRARWSAWFGHHRGWCSIS
jgi:hypothetical protein